MLNVYTSVLARRVSVTDDFVTLPYEAGWASEALVFLQTEGAHPALSVHADVSPDGINWIRRTGSTSLAPDQVIAELPVDRFGNWLRVAVVGATVDTPARILVHVALKG